ncbi:hypothetical protein PVK06_038424 [Gossypium arboreum]|uniref:Uncharacterized protein n=1 Tax=Gossypium arboreum TaxID=29729 RepID=A0ABR0N021_GOSAR|nr:hypothetical protein PVK06_038424 [Gossypium arboreum]
MRHPVASNRSTSLHPSRAPVTVTTGSSNGSNTSKVPSKGISPALIAERKQNGLCFWCGVKYHAGHKRVKGQLYQLLLESHSDGEGKDFRECSDQSNCSVILRDFGGRQDHTRING